jgi:hypothetical protein
MSFRFVSFEKRESQYSASLAETLDTASTSTESELALPITVLEPDACEEAVHRRFPVTKVVAGSIDEVYIYAA